MIVGRSGELGRLDQMLADVNGGGWGRALVVGDPGIGKTVLLGTVARRAASRRLRVVRVRVAEGEADLPFALVDDLFRAAGEPAPSSVPGVSRRSAALLDLLLAMTAIEPVLLLVDDMQNADDASVTAFSLAVERAAQAPLGVLVATRPVPDLEQRFSQWPRLELSPLSVDESVTLLRSVLGGTADESVLAALARTLQGHPLALTEVTALLTADQLAGRVPLPDHLPVTPALVAAWSGGLDRLPEPSRVALLCLAVAGSDPALLTVLLRASGCVAADLDEAVRGRLVVVRTGATPRFAHPMVREVVLDTAPAHLVRAVHERAARAAGQLGLPPSVVVRHLVRSVVLPDVQTAAAIADQAARAEQLGQYDAACRAWESAAQLSPTEDARVERALHGILLVVHLGLGGSAIGGLLDLVDGAPLEPEAARWVRWLGATLRADSDPAGSLSAQWAAIEDARRSSPELLPNLLWEAAATAWTLGDPEQGLRAAREVAELGAATTDTSMTTPSMTTPAWTGTALLAVAAFEAGDLERAMQLRAEALSQANAVDPATLDLATLLDVVTLDDLLLDMGEGAARRLAVAEEQMGEAAEPLACLVGIQAWRARARGDWGAARALLARGRPLADRVGATGAQRGMAALAVELAALSEDDEVLRREAARLRTLAGRWGDRRRLATLDRSLGLRALVDGRLEAAIASLAAAADVPFLGRGLRDGVLTARVDLVEALVRSGDRDAAMVRAGEIRPLLCAMGTPLALALAARVAALVAATDEDADRHYGEALDDHAAAGDPFEEARTLLLHGEQLRRSRRRREARLALESSVRLFESLGATPWLTRASEELRACGGSHAAAAGGGASLESLTAQELAVVKEVAAGRSNREVAGALFLSPRTVEFHLSNVYRKLGVRGRTGLVSRIRT